MLDSKKRAIEKWDAANLTRMSIAIPNSLAADLRNHVAETGESMNALIKRGIFLAMIVDELDFDKLEKDLNDRDRDRKNAGGLTTELLAAGHVGYEQATADMKELLKYTFGDFKRKISIREE